MPWFRLPFAFAARGPRAHHSSMIPFLDPMLGPLPDNSGPAFTHAILTGSVASNVGTFA